MIARLQFKLDLLVKLADQFYAFTTFGLDNSLYYVLQGSQSIPSSLYFSTYSQIENLIN